MRLIDPPDDNLSELLEELINLQILPVGREGEVKDVVSGRIQVRSVQGHVGQIGQRPHQMNLVQKRFDQIRSGRNRSLRGEQIGKSKFTKQNLIHHGATYHLHGADSGRILGKRSWWRSKCR